MHTGKHIVPCVALAAFAEMRAVAVCKKTFPSLLTVCFAFGICSSRPVMCLFNFRLHLGPSNLACQLLHVSRCQLPCEPTIDDSHRQQVVHSHDGWLLLLFTAASHLQECLLSVFPLLFHIQIHQLCFHTNLLEIPETMQMEYKWRCELSDTWEWT